MCCSDVCARAAHFDSTRPPVRVGRRHRQRPLGTAVLCLPTGSASGGLGGVAAPRAHLYFWQDGILTACSHLPSFFWGVQQDLLFGILQQPSVHFWLVFRAGCRRPLPQASETPSLSPPGLTPTTARFWGSLQCQQRNWNCQMPCAHPCANLHACRRCRPGTQRTPSSAR